MNIHCHSDVGEQAIVIVNSHVEGVRGDNTERKKGNVRVGMGESSDDLRMRIKFIGTVQVLVITSGGRTVEPMEQWPGSG